MTAATRMIALGRESDPPATMRARDPRAPFALTSSLLPLDRKARGYDIPLVLLMVALSGIGAVLVWAATRDGQIEAGANPNAFLYRHLVNAAIALVLMVVASRLDARLLRLFGPVVYVLSLLGLLLVIVAGSTINGAHAWIRLGGGFEVQPSEFMKLGMIVGMAVLFAQRGADREEGTPPTTADVLLSVGLVALPFALIMAQPDLGSAMVLACAAFGVLVAANVKARWTIGLLILGAVVAVVAVKAGVLQDYQLARFTQLANPGHDVQGDGYNVTQAHIAIANGGLFGTGLFHGPQTTGGFVPEQQTDFVFSVAGEEFGLLGAGADHRAVPAAVLARPAHRPRRRRRRPAARRRGRVLVRVPDVPEHRHEPRHDAGDRRAAAVRLLRRLVDVRPRAGDRPAASRPPA